MLLWFVKKPVVMLDVVPMMSKIMDNKVNDHNYSDWNKTIHLYFLSIDMDNHVVEDPLIDDSR